MQNKPFDPTKPVCTRDGRAARILCTDRKSTEGFTLIALTTNTNGDENQDCFQADGHFFSQGENHNDLVNVPVRVKREYWLNLYDEYKCATVHLSQHNANSAANRKRLACVPITVDCEEGAGL